MIDFCFFWTKAIIVQITYAFVTSGKVPALIVGFFPIRFVYFIIKWMGFNMSANWMFTEKDKLIINQIVKDTSSDPKPLGGVIQECFFVDCAIECSFRDGKLLYCLDKKLDYSQQRKKLAELYCLFALIKFLQKESYIALIPVDSDAFKNRCYVAWKGDRNSSKYKNFMRIELDKSFVPEFSNLVKYCVFATPKLNALVNNDFRTVEDLRFTLNLRWTVIAALAAILSAFIAAIAIAVSVYLSTQ